MTNRTPKYEMHEYARRGRDWYEQRIRPRIEAGNRGRIVAIDIDSGAFEVSDDSMKAAEQLLDRIPDAQIWFVRIGHRGVHRFGARAKRDQS